eukprot:g4004.t1
MKPTLAFTDSDGDRIVFTYDRRSDRIYERVNKDSAKIRVTRVRVRASDMSVTDQEEEIMHAASPDDFLRIFRWFREVQHYVRPDACEIDVVDNPPPPTTTTPSSSSFSATARDSPRPSFSSSSTSSVVAAATISPRVKRQRTTLAPAASAKRAFALAHVPCDRALPIRGRQIRRVEDFVLAKLSACSGGAMYVCGSPGTGKTMAVARAIRRVRDNLGSIVVAPDVVGVNAMTLQTESQIADALWARLDTARSSSSSFKFCARCRGLGGRLDDRGGATAMARLKCRMLHRTASPSSPMCLVVVDEIDAVLERASLAASPTGPLHQLFEWAGFPGSKLVLVGIANGVGLVSRYLPRLRALRCEPELVVFEPYDAEQLASILRQRLDTVSGRHLISDRALEFCAKKVASVSGDARRALDVCRRALDEVASSASSSVVVDMRDMAKVLRVSFGSQSAERVRETTSRARMLLCVVVALCTSRGKKSGGGGGKTPRRRKRERSRRGDDEEEETRGGKRAKKEGTTKEETTVVRRRPRTAVGIDTTAMRSGVAHIAATTTPATVGEVHRGYSAMCRHLRRPPPSFDDVRGLLMQLTESGLVRLGKAVGGKGAYAVKKRKVEIAIPHEDVVAGVAESDVMTKMLCDPRQFLSGIL